jgi:hypothetical protein
MGIVSYVEAQMIPGHLVAHILPNDKHYKRKQVGLYSHATLLAMATHENRVELFSSFRLKQ